MKKVKDYFWYSLMILGVSIMCILILPYGIYKSYKHQSKSK